MLYRSFPSMTLIVRCFPESTRAAIGAGFNSGKLNPLMLCRCGVSRYQIIPITYVRKTAFLQCRRCRNKRQHVCFISRRISSAGRRNLKPCLFKFTRSSGHVPGMRYQRNIADPVLFQNGETLVGIFTGIGGGSFSPSYWNLKLLSSTAFICMASDDPVPGRSARCEYGLAGKSMQPRRVADALEAQAAYSVTAIFRRVKV